MYFIWKYFIISFMFRFSWIFAILLSWNVSSMKVNVFGLNWILANWRKSSSTNENIVKLKRKQINKLRLRCKWNSSCTVRVEHFLPARTERRKNEEINNHKIWFILSLMFYALLFLFLLVIAENDKIRKPKKMFFSFSIHSVVLFIISSFTFSFPFLLWPFDTRNGEMKNKEISLTKYNLYLFHW